MSEINFSTLNVGDEIPSFTTHPISRTTLALFAGASGDHNPIHIDIDFAQKAGMEDVFAHGMLSMAYMAQVVTNWVPQSRMKGYSTRFASITHLKDKITCRGKITETLEKDGENLVRLELTAANQDGDIKLQGEALVSLN